MTDTPDVILPPPSRPTVMLTVVFVFALAARLMHLAHKPFWFDEVLTLRRVHLAPGGLIADSFANRHMPSYFLLLHWFARIGGDVLALRLPSALFGALCVALAAEIARRIGGRAAAIATAVLMALSPQQVQYGQEARSYTLAMLLVLVALWGLVRLAQTTDRARLHWFAYGAGTAASLDVLGGTLPWLLAANLALILIWRRRGHDRAMLRPWAVTHGLIAVATLPFYALMLRANAGHMIQNFNWIPRLSWHGLWVAVASTYLMRASLVVSLDLLPTSVPMLAGLVAAMAVVGVWRVRHRLDGAAVVLAFAVLPVLAVSVSLVRPMLVPRYILWSAAPFFILAGLGAAALPRRFAPPLLAGLVLLACANLAPFYQAETKPRWDLAAKRLAAVVRPRDTILTSDPNARAMLLALQPKWSTADATVVITPKVDVAVGRWRQGSRVFVVNGRSALGREEPIGVLKARLQALGTPTEQIPLGQEITILVFAPPCREQPANTVADITQNPGRCTPSPA